MVGEEVVALSRTMKTLIFNAIAYAALKLALGI